MRIPELFRNKRVIAGAILCGIALLAGFTALFTFLMSGGSAEPVSETVYEEPPPPPVVEIKTEEPKKPEIKIVVKEVPNKTASPLTGELIDKESAKKRPYAVMINNMRLALPQSGIANADILYEVLAEGGITRILAVFQEYNAEKIGPIRSARHYYLDFAFDNDAIYVHHGGSPQGYEAIRRLDVDNLDGMNLDGTSFWRDPERFKIPRMYEHSSYTSSQNIYDTAVEYGYRVERDKSFPYMFSFYNVRTSVGGEHGDTIELPFSNEQISSFTYNPQTRLYERYQNGEPHIDAETGEQLTASNVIVQYANIYVIPGDSEGRRNVELVSEGRGVLYTNGTSKEITWAKESHESPTLWKDAEGAPLKLNKGKTWICVIREPE